jgi:RND family efflux transporter MFP subunit
MTALLSAEKVKPIRAEVLLAPQHREEPKESRRWIAPRIVAMGVLVVLVLTGGLVAGTLPRLRQEERVQAAADAVGSSPPRVTVVRALQQSAGAERLLPGNSQPLLDASIYARTTGYLKRRLVDIGDRVEEGQLLAEIATPEIDAQLAQTRAALQQSKANLVRATAQAVYAKAEYARYRQMARTGAASREDYESKVSAARVADATVKADEEQIKLNEANVLRLETLVSFQQIKAPFQGVITARNVEKGDLISADSPNTTKEMFHLMRTDILRVFVDVPQVFATGIKVDQRAIVYRREDPRKRFAGKVTRTADALDSSTRTLRTEVQVANPDNALRPGMYLQVKFVFPREQRAVLIPSAAVVTRAGAPRVAVLDDQQRVQYRTVQVGRDYGAKVQVLAGLTAGERIVVHPGDDVPEGTVVSPVAPAQK